MAKQTDGDDLIDDDDASVAVAPKRPDRAKNKNKALTNGTAPKAKRTTSKAKASSNGTRTKVVHKTPKAGSKFTAKYKGKTHTMTVKRVKGEIIYAVKGKAHKSPSAAASAVIDAGRSNGWKFWGIE